jgi:hypothetical protein
MDTRISPSATSAILLLMAVTSLLIMLSLNQINYMVHGDLYNFGLQFSYRWAMPYWILSGIVFGLSWTNIAVSIVFTLYIQKKSRKRTLDSARIPQTERTEAIALKADEKEQKKISEFLDAQKEESVVKEEATIKEPIEEDPVKADEIVEAENKQELQVVSEETEQIGQIVENQETPIATPIKKENDKQNQTVL